MSMIVIEAADGSGKTTKRTRENWLRWPKVKDATGKLIPDQRMWGNIPTIIQGEGNVPRPIRTSFPKAPQVPVEVAQDVSAPAVPEEVQAAAPAPKEEALQETVRNKPGPKPKVK